MTPNPGVPSQLARRAAVVNASMRGGNRVAVLVHELGAGKLVVLGVGVLDVADRASHPGDAGGDPFVAARADADRPIHGRDRPDLGAPLRAHLGQIIGEDEGRAGAVGAMHDGNSLRRQLDVWIEPSQRGVVPRLDLAEEDLGQGRPVDGELARLDALDVHHRHDAADHGGKLRETVCLEIGWLERHVGGAEGHLLILDLPDPLARTDRLVVHRDAGRFLVGLGPFGIDRIGKGGAGARNLGADRRGRRQRQRRW